LSLFAEVRAELSRLSVSDRHHRDLVSAHGEAHRKARERPAVVVKKKKSKR
jgi:hypothetical protein